MKSLDQQLEMAIYIATKEHFGQKDKSGAPYILHVLRVFETVRKAGYNSRYQIAALLHDVVEDTPVQPVDLVLDGIDNDIVNSVEHLTKAPGEEYMDYVQRAVQDPIACVVKLHDNQDNLNRTRFLEDEATAIRLRDKYKGARVIIQRAFEEHTHAGRFV